MLLQALKPRIRLNRYIDILVTNVITKHAIDIIIVEYLKLYYLKCIVSTMNKVYRPLGVMNVGMLRQRLDKLYYIRVPVS